MRKRTGQSAFFSARALLALLACGVAGASILNGTLLAFFHSDPANPPRTLTFAERVAYQRTIEEVYWRHRIWPKERPDPKPSLDVVMSQAQLKSKVHHYLRKSQALQDYWQQPITSEHLQAEMNRMAKHTKQPEVLRELFEALGNDPFVIAECLVRPALAERLLTNSYAYDQRIHGELKERAKAELQAHGTVEQMKQTHGDYSEIEIVRSESAPGKENHENVKSVRRNGREWEETVQKVAETFNIGGSKTDPSTDPGGCNNSAEAKNVGARAYQAIPIGKLTSLQEDDTRYYTVAVVGKGNDQLKLATVSWLKEPLHSWLAKAETQVPVTIVAVDANYTLPVISGYSDNSVPSVACTDAWTLTNLTNVPDPRTFPTAVWTGSEMIVWGGYPQLNTGGKYDPSTDSWTATSTVNAPAGRELHTAVWTGSEMIVWGGRDVNGDFPITGGRYCAQSGSPSPTPTPTATPCTGRCSPTPRPRPTPHPRP